MIKSLSKQEYDLLSTFAIKNRKVITVKDVKGYFNFTAGKIRVMLHRLEKKGWLGSPYFYDIELNLIKKLICAWADRQGIKLGEKIKKQKLIKVAL